MYFSHKYPDTPENMEDAKIPTLAWNISSELPKNDQKRLTLRKTVKKPEKGFFR